MSDDIWRVLIIDDNPEGRQFLRLLLEGAKRRFQFDEAETGAAGLRICLESETGPPDCVLLDDHLPDYEAPEWLAALGGPDLLCCPVVVVVGRFAEGLDGPALLRLGAQDFISKAWMNRESLSRCVENAIERFSMSQALREKEQSLSESQHIAHIGSWNYEADGRISWSEETYRLWGLSPDSFTPDILSFEVSIFPDDRPAMRAWIAACKAGENPGEIVFRRLLPDGSLRYLCGQGELRQGTGRMAGTVQDITARKKTELALMESEERLRLALDAAQLGIFDWDILNNRIAWTRRHEEIWGFQPGEFGGQYADFASRVHPDDLPGVDAAIARSMAERNRYSHEYRVVWPDGSVHWVVGIGEFSFDAAGRAVRMRGVAEEITEQKRREQALHEAETLRATSRYVRTLIETSLDPLVMISPDGKITDVNAATENVVGWPREVLVGTDFADYVADPVAAKEGYQLVFRNGSVRDFALEIRHRDGHLTPVLYNAAVYRDESGNVAGIFAAARDITEQKRAEKVIRDLYHRITHISTRVPGVIYQFKLRPDGSSCFPYASEAIREIYRVAPEDVQEDAAAVFAILHPEDYDGIVASIQQSAMTLQPWQYEYRVRFPDGTVRWLQGNSIPDKEDDGSILWHGFITDITERKRAELALQKSEHFAQAILDSVNHMIAVIDNDGVILAINECWRRFAIAHSLEPGKQAPGTDVGSNYLEICRAAVADKSGDAMAAINGIRAVLDGELAFFNREYACHETTQKHWFSMRVTPLGAGGEGAVITHIDITELKQAEEALRESESRLRAQSTRLQNILRTASDGIHILDQQGNVMQFSDSFAQMLGYTHAEMLKLNVADWEAQIPKTQLLDLIQRIIQQAERFETKHRRKDGSIIDVEINAKGVELEGQHYLYASARDISARKALEEKIENIAYHDILTGLPNRLLVSDRLNQALARAKRSECLLVIGYLDLDGFKPINDTFGHAAGDRLLQILADRMKTSIRAHDTVGRLGGDEFVLLLTNLNTMEEYKAALDRVIQAINQPVVIDEIHAVKVGVSIGITFYPLDNSDPDTLLRHADQAMYQAKKLGRNCVCLFAS